jgi:hypothetical protein
MIAARSEEPPARAGKNKMEALARPKQASHFDVISQKQSNTSEYIPALDGLRALAVISVVCRRFEIPGFAPVESLASTYSL